MKKLLFSVLIVVSVTTMFAQVAPRANLIQGKQETLSVGRDAPDFTATDVHGNEFRLSSLKGKYVVLDFWGSWCKWCIKGFPEMKEAYAELKGKNVEFVGIACKDQPDKWRKTVADNELPWINVVNGKNPDITQIYFVKGYPTKIIIDPQGTIVNVTLGESPEFYLTLKQLIK